MGVTSRSPLTEFSEDGLDWGLAQALTNASPTRAAAPWAWHQPDHVVSAPTWGGCLEVVGWNLAAGRWILPTAVYAGCVLLLETSEERPGADEVRRLLRTMGERGLLAQFPAVARARARASDPPGPRAHLVAASDDEREAYRSDQRNAVLQELARYNPEAMAVFGVDFGHTSPQWVLPYGGRLTVDEPARRVIAHD